MLGLNEVDRVDIQPQGSEPTRRRRTPSKYAESIKALTNVECSLILDQWQKISEREKIPIQR